MALSALVGIQLTAWEEALVSLMEEELILEFLEPARRAPLKLALERLLTLPAVWQRELKFEALIKYAELKEMLDD